MSTASTRKRKRRRKRSSPAPLTYGSSGVDIDAGDRAVDLIRGAMRSTHGSRVLSRHGSFAGMFRLDYSDRLFRRNFRDPVLVACTDGVGTKVKIAVELGVLDTIGIDCVAMNVNDMIVQGAEPLFFLDYLGLHRQVPEHTADIVKGVARGCRIAGCALLGGECAEMPDIYAQGDFDIAGFAVGVVEMKRVVDPSRVERGDIVIAVASDGLHSNGYTLVRRILRARKLKLSRFYPELEGSSSPDGTRLSLGEILLQPTRIYVHPILDMLKRYKVKRIVTGMAHITGGGIGGNVSRTLPGNLDAVLRRDTWDVPPIFRFLQDRGGIADDEMMRVFNMGVGYCLIVRPAFANAVQSRLQSAGEHAWVLGKIDRGRGRVHLR